MIDLSIIIPAYNESKRLPKTLRGILEYSSKLASKNGWNIEIVIADDGSKDNTVEVAQEIWNNFADKNGLYFQINSVTQNQGKGATVKRGMLESKGKWRLFADADNSTPIEELDKMLPYLDKYDVVIGSRYLIPGSIKNQQPWQRRLLSRISNLVIQTLILPGIIDTQCGFKMFSDKATQTIFPKQSMSGWSFDIEVLAITKKQGYKIKEVGVDWYDVGDSRLRAIHAAVKSFRDLLIIWRNSISGKYNN